VCAPVRRRSSPDECARARAPIDCRRCARSCRRFVSGSHSHHRRRPRPRPPPPLRQCSRVCQRYTIPRLLGQEQRSRRHPQLQQRQQQRQKKKSTAFRRRQKPQRPKQICHLGAVAAASLASTILERVVGVAGASRQARRHRSRCHRRRLGGRACCATRSSPYPCPTSAPTCARARTRRTSLPSRW
jgi:hypothetical protein